MGDHRVVPRGQPCAERGGLVRAQTRAQNRVWVHVTPSLSRGARGPPRSTAKMKIKKSPAPAFWFRGCDGPAGAGPRAVRISSERANQGRVETGRVDPSAGATAMLGEDGPIGSRLRHRRDRDGRRERVGKQVASQVAGRELAATALARLLSKLRAAENYGRNAIRETTRISGCIQYFILKYDRRVAVIAGKSALLLRCRRSRWRAVAGIR